MTQTNLKNNPNSSLLKETRLAKGLTLDIVHEATKIPLDALRAIEEGYSTRILTPFYYRGFIKIYAEFLGMNVAEALKEYNVQSSAVKTAIPKPISSKSAKKSKVSHVVREQVSESFREFWTPKNRNNLFRVLLGIVAIILAVRLVGCIAMSMKNSPKAVKGSVAKDNKKQNTLKKNTVSKEDMADQESNATIAAVSRNHKVSLAVHAPKDIWIQVKTDGQMAFQMTMKKGTVESWEAKDEIQLSGKNLNDLDVEVNGKDVNLSDSSNRRVRKVLITRDGLTVKS